MSIIPTLSNWMSRMSSGPLAVPTVKTIPRSKVTPLVEGEIRRGEVYFSLEINEMHLSKGYRWWVDYDPAVFVVCEFSHDGKVVSVPKIVGPSMIPQQMGKIPHGIVIHDTLVAGPHPYRGGRISISVLLYAVASNNMGREMLSLLESVSKSVGVPANMPMLFKMGDLLLTGAQTILGLESTIPIAGHRVELDDGNIDGVRPFHSFVAAGTWDASRFSVQNNRLLYDDAQGRPQAFRESDFVLYSMKARVKRGDPTQLEYYSLQKDALAAAALGDDESWKRAKSILLTIYQKMLTSPDLIRSEAEDIFLSCKQELLQARNEGLNNMNLSLGDSTKELKSSSLNEIVSVLDL